MKRNGELRDFGVIANRLGIRELRKMGFSISETNLKPQDVLELIEKQVELPSAFDLAKADDIELQKITENAARSIENHTEQLEGGSSEDLPMRELLCLDKQLRSIRDLRRH